MKEDFMTHALGIVGSGAMGRGIAQISALAGIDVHLSDINRDAVDTARGHLRDTLTMLAGKGRITTAAAAEAVARIIPADSLEALKGCDVIVEAIAENLEAKRALFKQLDAMVRDTCILASNTSSLSITAIAAACSKPERVAGFHFFNPVPLMKVIEVVDGLRGARSTGDRLVQLAHRLGHTPVRAKDMPGFIVNHAGRAMNTEGLRIVGEGIADFADIDRIMREQAGFRLGPFELMDLTSLDVSHPVMESIYQQFYEEPRFRPSPLTAIRLSGGLVGKKTGEGFYKYVDGKPVPQPEAGIAADLPERVWVSSRDAIARTQIAGLISAAGITMEKGDRPSEHAVIIVAPLGKDATTAAIEEGLDATRVVALDCLLPVGECLRRTLMTTPVTEARFLEAARALFAHDGAAVTTIRDSNGFVAQRIVASIVNVGCDIAQQRIASPEDIDRAVTLGLGYPKGPLALGDAIGAARIMEILSNMQGALGDPRYRPSPWLKRRAQLGTSLTRADT
ncbi:3-hydroxyacyl-CoA dehydrogenase [Paraburkholderia fungorum]|uniref:3-hydroxyacyl-CoA dehydrogenase n=1 Tax=Paraburkholderia fungorum TaxID=134537 RepID=UPI0038B8D27C